MSVRVVEAQLAQRHALTGFCGERELEAQTLDARGERVRDPRRGIGGDLQPRRCDIGELRLARGDAERFADGERRLKRDGRREDERIEADCRVRRVRACENVARIVVLKEHELGRDVRGDGDDNLARVRDIGELDDGVVEVGTRLIRKVLPREVFRVEIPESVFLPLPHELAGAEHVVALRPTARQKFALVVVDVHTVLDGQGRRRHIDDFVKPFLRGFGEVKRRAASERDGGCAAQRNRAKAQHAARFDRQCRAHLVGRGNMERHARLDDDAR